MFSRLLLESFRRQRRRKLLAGVAILLGTTAVTAMLALALAIGDRIHKELAVYGANIVVYPKADLLDVKIGGVDVKPATGGTYLKESDLEKLKGIFWTNNITGVSPELSLNMMAGKLPLRTDTDIFPVHATAYWFDHTFGSLKTGAAALHPWWRIDGRWPGELPCSVSTQVTPESTAQSSKTKYPPCPAYNAPVEVAVGSEFARQHGLKLGDSFLLGDAPTAEILEEPMAHVVGIVETGDALDGQVFLNLDNPLLVIPNAVSRVDIAARTKPEDAFARVDPDSLSPQQREIWYCRPYANSIAFQIREAIPGAQAEQVRRVEQSEGTVLERISGLMWLISAAALLAAGFAVSAAMATAILERRAEIGLMRSMGASRRTIALLFYSEAGLLAVLAGVLGYGVGSVLAAVLGARIFAGDGPVTAAAVLNPVLLPVVLGLALLVAVAGSTPAIREALRLDPSAILRGEA
jgi:putative ABC transport system permease protein